MSRCTQGVALGYVVLGFQPVALGYVVMGFQGVALGYGVVGLYLSASRR